MHVTGFFEETATFGEQTVSSTGGQDIFYARYDSGGTLLGVTTAGGPDDDYSSAFGVLADGASYVAGFFVDSMTLSETVLTGTGGTDAFLAKYTRNGELAWATSAGGVENDYAESLAFLADGSVCLLGSFSGEADFGARTLTAVGVVDSFLIAYDPEGSVKWVKQAGGTGGTYAKTLATRLDGSVFVSGSFNGETAFGSTILISEAGTNDVFLGHCLASDSGCGRTADP